MRTGLAILATIFAGCASRYNLGSVPDREECAVEIRISNMACSDACPPKVRGALARVPGVTRVDVSYDEGFAELEAQYPACSKDGFEQMLDALAARGYRASIVGSHTLGAFP